MNISEKIKEMQGDLDKYQVLEKNEEECKLEDMVMLMLNDQGYLGPGKIIDENEESLDFMFYQKEGPTFSLKCLRLCINDFIILTLSGGNFYEFQ